MHPLRVADVVTGAVDAIRPSAAAAKLRLTCPPPAADLIVSGNPAQLERVLVNLLSNAVKFTPERGGSRSPRPGTTTRRSSGSATRHRHPRV